MGGHDVGTIFFMGLIVGIYLTVALLDRHVWNIRNLPIEDEQNVDGSGENNGSGATSNA